MSLCYDIITGNVYDADTLEKVGYLNYVKGKGYMYDLFGFNESDYYVSDMEALDAAIEVYDIGDDE